MSASTDPPAKTPRKQMNVRLPENLVDEIDRRRNLKGLSRDKWVERALIYAITQGPRPPRPGQQRSGPRR